MALSPFTAGAAMPVWQDPFVEVIKFGMNHRSVGWHAQGDVEQIQDPQLHKNVFRVRGAIAATNYLRVPKDATSGTQGLGLTGRFVYIQLRCIQDLPVTLHLDFITNKKNALRFTLSSLFQSLRSTGTVLRVPLLLSNRWTVLVLDMAQLLELHTFNQYAREQFHHLKARDCGYWCHSATLCAAANYRNVFVSATLYTEQTLPTALRLSDATATTQYDWHALPVPATLLSPRRIQRARKRANDMDRLLSPTSVNGRTAAAADWSRHRNINNNQLDVDFPTHSTLLSPRIVMQKTSPASREHDLHRDRTSILSRADQIVRGAGIVQRVASTNASPPPPPLSSSTVRSPSVARATNKQKPRTSTASVTATEWPDPILTLAHIVGFSNAFPNALQWIRNSATQCIYTSDATIIVRDLQPPPDDDILDVCMATTDAPIESSAATCGGRSVVDDPFNSVASEHVLHSHTASVSCMALSSDGALLVTAEKRANTVRVWRLQQRECVTTLRAQTRGVHALCFSAKRHHNRQLQLCAVGRDDAGRVQILVWDCAALDESDSRGVRPIAIVARQTCDFAVSSIAFSPYVANELVSCGKENVRVWRLRKRHVVGTPVILNAYARGTVFTTLAFDAVYEAFPTNIEKMRPLYVATSLGTLLVIDYDARSVVCVYQLHNAAINCIAITEGFCVTGSDDRFLRVWPLDFTDFLLEAQHEAGVASVDVSFDGLRVLVGSRNGAIGVLDISDQRYDTILRSHTHAITAMALTPVSLLSRIDGDSENNNIAIKREEIVTTSNDGTLRIWATRSGRQLFEFDVQHDRVTCLTASLTLPGVLAVGFASGMARIFDVHPSSNDDSDNSSSSTRVVCAFQQHASPLCSIQFDPDSAFLYTSATGQQLCLYDVNEHHYTPIKMLIADLCVDVSDGSAGAATAAAVGKFCLSSDKKYIAMLSSDRHSVVLLHAQSLRPWCAITPRLETQAQTHHYAATAASSRHRSSASTSSTDATLKDLLLSPDARELVVLATSDRLFVYAIETRALVQTMQLLVPQPITAFTLSPNAQYMATGSADGSLCVWRWSESQRFRRMQQRFVGQTGAISRLSFTSDGTAVVATGAASTIYIWRCHGDATAPAAAESSALLQATAFVQGKHTSANVDDAAAVVHRDVVNRSSVPRMCSDDSVGQVDGADRSVYNASVSVEDKSDRLGRRGDNNDSTSRVQHGSNNGNSVDGAHTIDRTVSDANDSHENNSSTTKRSSTRSFAVHPFNLSRTHDDVDATAQPHPYDPEEMSPSLHVPVPSTKPTQFSLQLAMDALVLQQHDVTAAAAEQAQSDKLDTDDSSVVTSTLQLSTVERGKLAVSSVVVGLQPRYVAWSYTAGCLVFAARDTVVIEQLASGQQTVHCAAAAVCDDTTTDDKTPVQVELMCLSPSQQRVATVTTKRNGITVTRIKGATDASESSSDSNTSCVILLPTGVDTVDAVTFVYEAIDDGSNSSEDTSLLCFSCCFASQTPDATTGVFVACVTTGAIVWSRTSTTSERVRTIIAVTPLTFITLAGDNGCLEMHSLVSAAIEAFKSDPTATNHGVVASRLLLASFPSPIVLTCASPSLDPHSSRRRFLLCIDHDAYCYVFDVMRECLIATTQLMLLATEQRRVPKGFEIDFLEWLHTEQSQSLARASRASRTLYVHRFPLTTAARSSSSSSRVDWQLVARSGLSILYHIDLESLPRSLSVDPLRGLGIVALDDGAVTLLVFKDGAPRRVVKQLAGVNVSDRMPPSPYVLACWAMDDAVLVTLDATAHALCCYVPETAREVARVYVRDAICTAIAVNSAFLPLTPTACAGAIVLAGFDDGVLRAFDVSAMKLLAQTSLSSPPSSSASASASSRSASRYEHKSLETLKRKFATSASPQRHARQNARITQIHFVGSCAALVVLGSGARVVLVDFSDVLLDKEDMSPAKQRAPAIVYREVVVLQQQQQRTKRDACSTDVRVIGVDVKPQVDAQWFVPAHAPPAVATPRTVFPFLLITSALASNASSVKVYGRNDMLTSTDDELTPTDAWSLATNDVTQTASASFLPGNDPLVLYVVNAEAMKTPRVANQSRWWFEVRDYKRQRVVRRFQMDRSACFSHAPTLLKRLGSRESDRMLLTTDSGDVFALDLTDSNVVPIGSDVLHALGLTLSQLTTTCSAVANRQLLLQSSSSVAASSSTNAMTDSVDYRRSLAVASIAFEKLV